jgi:hypothetical protein
MRTANQIGKETGYEIQHSRAIISPVPGAMFATPMSAQEILPFPPKLSGKVAGGSNKDLTQF